MSTNTHYSMFAETKTRNGLAADEVISCLQKSIRRAMAEEACGYAYELYISSPLLLEKLWRRLLTISVEDIGFGNPEAALQLQALNEMRKNFPYNDGDQPMFFIHAIRILCESTKDRSSDLLKNIVIKSFAMGKIPEIMDVALDKHTKRGVQMGRGSQHFLEEGSKVCPELEVTNGYKERYREILKEYNPDRIVENAFVYSSDQY